MIITTTITITATTTTTTTTIIIIIIIIIMIIIIMIYPSYLHIVIIGVQFRVWDCLFTHQGAEIELSLSCLTEIL